MRIQRGKQLDAIMDHKEAKQFVKENGPDRFIREMEEEFDYGLECVTVAWQDDPKYICKMYGRRGDIIIGWEGVHHE